MGEIEANDEGIMIQCLSISEYYNSSAGDILMRLETGQDWKLIKMLKSVWGYFKPHTKQQLYGLKNFASNQNYQKSHTVVGAM